MKIKKVLTKAARQIIKYENFDGGLAQSVERRNHNPCVVGSNPSPATIKRKPVLFVPALVLSVRIGFETTGSGFVTNFQADAPACGDSRKVSPAKVSGSGRANLPPVII